jgi:hypothetical protein
VELMAAVWHVKRGENIEGPYSLDNLNDLARAGIIGKEDLIKSEQMNNWVKAGTMPGLTIPASETSFNEPPPLTSHMQVSWCPQSYPTALPPRADPFVPPPISKPNIVKPLEKYPIMEQDVKTPLEVAQSGQKKRSYLILVVSSMLILAGIAGYYLTANQEKYSFMESFISVKESTQQAGPTVLDENIAYDDGTYTGPLLNGLPHGKGIWTKLDGTSYEGEFKAGKFHGIGTLINKDGDRYTGNFKDGIKEGYGVYTSADNGVRYEGEFKAGKFHGRGTLIYNDGQKYAGDFSEGLVTGRGKMTYANGDSYEGEFLNGLRHGYGKYIFSDGEVLAGNWQDNYPIQ